MIIYFRYLATGESYRSLAFSYRVGASTLSALIPEVCDIIWEKMSGVHLKIPQSDEDWKLVATNFCHKWQFPNCLGSLDGKHVVIRSPDCSGSWYFNYKGTMSIVLLALADAYLRFQYIDIGGYGRNSDGGIFAESSLGKALAQNRLKLPEDTSLPDAPELGRIPYVIVADEAFPLAYHIMRPYPGKSLTRERRAFNYRLSRARRIIECAFGVLAARWRIFHTKIAIAPHRVKKIVKAAVVLHNLVQTSTTPTEITAQMEETYEEETEMLQNLQHYGTRGSNEALQVREKLTTYFNQHKVPWQDAHIDRGLH